MNRGEGLKYAAHAKSGQINLFKEQKKKTKKFSYKGRGQQFPVRKIQAQDSIPQSQPASTVPHSTSATKKVASAKSHTGNTKNRQAATEPKRKPGQKDFVKKNAPAAQKARQKVESGNAGGGGNTVTLTQEQLNAILATIGKAAGGSGIANVSLENGNIKVDDKESQGKANTQSSKKTSAKSPGTEEDGKNGDPANTSGENVLSLLAKGKDTSESSHGKDTGNQSSQSPNPVNDAPAELVKSPESESGKPHRKGDQERTRNKGGIASGVSHTEKKPPAGMGYGDVSSITGLNQKELAEKKKQQWKRELDEQMALKRQQQANAGGSRGGRSRDDDDQQTGRFWGQSGLGASQTQKGVRGLHAGMSLDLSGVTAADQSDGLPSASKSKDPMSSQTVSPRKEVTSSLGKLATQKYTPAAMRSSFIIGGDPIDSHNMTVKQLEKKQWLEDLERQRKEAKDRKEQEKRKRQEFDDRLTSQWAEQVTSPRSKSVAHTHGKPTSTVDDIVVKQAPETTVQVETSPQRHHSADAVQNGREEDLSTVSHARPFGLLVDPAEAERREQQRQKHLEHMMAVKAQVEERQRQKREAMEAKKREEAEEERRLAQERDMLQRQFEMEKEKQRKKEEDAVAKQAALLESVQAAYERAQHDKHQKRVQKLAEHGHNVDNLRRSWEVTRVSPETSTRTQHGYQPVRHSPHLEPITTTTTTTTSTSSPRHSITQDPSPTRQPAPSVGMQDASTSPVFDQAVQTDFQFPPSDVLLERAFEIQREASAGIEYRPEKQTRRKPDGQKKGKGQDRAVKSEDKSKRLTKEKSQEVPDEESKSNRTKGVKNRPLWGQTNQRKKKLGNTEKDLTVNQKKREERRKQRMEELMALQEKNAPKRLSEKKKAASLPQSRTASVTRADSTLNARAEAITTRAATEIDLRRDRTPSDAWADDREVELPPSPPLHSGDFVPFLRHDEELIERSIPGSPASRQSQCSRMKGRENQMVTPKPEKGRSSSVDKNVKDPLLNPERLKDSNLRQEKILEQLSNLRQGLMMKQRELEMGLSTPLVM